MTERTRWRQHLDPRTWPRRYVVATLLYTLLAAVFVHDWDGYVFQTAARQLWEGLTPYAVAAEEPWYGFLGVADEHVQWYAYPPLPLVLMALSYAPAVFFDLPPPLARVLVKLPVIIGTLLLARVAGAWAAHLGHAERRTRVEHAFLWNPFFVLVGPVWGMTDTLLVAFFLAGLLWYHQGLPRRAGCAIAAAVLVKPFALLLALPALAHGMRTRPIAETRSALAAGALFGAAWVAPFALADPAGFWSQVVGVHLARPVQGVTIWTWWPLSLLSEPVVAVWSLALIGVALAALSVLATRLQGAHAPLWAMLAAAVVILLVNRVVNEQYLVMAMAPMLLVGLAPDPGWRARMRLDRASWLTSSVAALTVILFGFHFVTFIPPDVALPLFGRPVDAVAHSIRAAAPAFWATIGTVLPYMIPLVLLFCGWVVAKRLRGVVASPLGSEWRAAAPSVTVSALLVLVAVMPVMAGALGGTQHPAPVVAAEDEPLVATFYYLWWQNAAHDPAIEYGNWFPVSQTPTMGYYTNTRGVAREHARMMVDNGIDAAIVSYHRGEEERYRVFQEEATKVGLKVAPLIELNQVYDQPRHRPIDHNGTPVTYAAYRLDDGTRQAFEDFVFAVGDRIQEPGAWRIDGRPVVMFYDSYVSAVGYHEEDQRALAQVVVDAYGFEALQTIYEDPHLDTVDDLIGRYPPTYKSFFLGNHYVWREAHLLMHERFWTELRTDLEAELGPLHLVSGDAFNERAGFESGTVKSILDLGLFDSSFIYSPSFTWGVNQDQPFDVVFDMWENRNIWMDAFARGLGRGSVVGIAPAYDDTVNRPEIGFVIPPVVDGVDFYDRSWQSVTRHRPSVVAIATFNEFFEGSGIEPSIEFGDRWLHNTSMHAERFAALPGPARTTVVVMHETESRTHPGYSEQDEPHKWGLDLIAATARARTDEVVAIDGRARLVAVEKTPDLLVVEGGRPDYRVSPIAAERIGEWAAGSVPTILVGPVVAESVPVDLARCAALPTTPEGEWTLVTGDRLSVQDDGLVLERNGDEVLVGVRCDDTLSLLRFKPFSADPVTDAACWAVAVTAMAPTVVDEPRTWCQVGN